MTDKVIGYGVSWNGPDKQPDFIERKRGDHKVNPHAGKLVYHSERFKHLNAARAYAKTLHAVSGREKIRVHQIELMDGIPGFPMAFWKEISLDGSHLQQEAIDHEVREANKRINKKR